ncbi:MAG: hypothetical protein H0X12_10500 [Nocardioides sp.]|nr:hypothetical protein [Nocardioides sp.]
MSDDLAQVALAVILGDRPVRAYPALLSTEAAAMAWARTGAPSGAVVVADYQASPRGRGGLPWTVEAGRGLGFSLIVRPTLPPEREGWPYVAASLALAEVLGDEATLEWPDTVLAADAPQPVARLGTYVELGPNRTEWLTITAHVLEAPRPRGPMLARLVSALELRVGDAEDRVLAAYLSRCVTLGREVRARMIPMGPDGPEVTGEAVDVLADGSLVVMTARGNRVAVPPQNLGLLEDPEMPSELPPEIARRLEDRA